VASEYAVYDELRTRDLKLPNPDNQIPVLEQILLAYMNNPFIVNRYIIMPTNQLASLIKLMTDAENVEIQVAYDVACCGQATNYNLVDAIVVIKNNQRTDFTVAYNELSRKLNDYRISLKFTTDE
jgi:hypothetical protein